MPEIKEEWLLYLDNLRDSGITNMYGAAPYLAGSFGIDKSKARDVLAYWMKTFEERHST